MKKPVFRFNIILLLYFISNTKEDICQEEEINISPLGKCRNISDILEGRNISIKEENLFYLAANNGRKNEKMDIN